ncbi:MAG: hypothetical protein H6Q06_1647 [Acidobacteria bacterium]|nr:hypothetical protein [Acidobacteriota bacterium]
MGMTTHFVMFLILAAFSPLCSATAQEEKETSLQGKLQISEGKATVVVEQGKAVSLESDVADVAATLSDERISGRPVKVLGRFRPDGVFSVREFYVVRPESLYRIIYFCDTCHITTFAPGDCACCQEPTVPTEVLPTDPRIYHEEVTGQPKR